MTINPAAAAIGSPSTVMRSIAGLTLHTIFYYQLQQQLALFVSVFLLDFA